MASIYPRIIAIAWPLILSNLSVPILGIADTAMLGHLDSPLYLGAVALGASLVTLVLASTNFLRMSTTGLSAQAFGRQDHSECALVFRDSVLLGFALAILLLALSPWISRFGLHLMLDAENQPALYEYAREYVDIRFWGAPATLLNYVIVGWAVGQQNSRLALLSLTTTALLNIVFDALLIIGLDMNSRGAAWATVMAEYTSLAICLLYLGKFYPWLGQYLIQKSHQGRRALTQLLRLNADFFIRSLSLLWVFAYFNRSSASLGETVLAANAILIQLTLLQSYALDGFANATEALIGEVKGKRVNQAGFREMLSATAKASLVAALVIVIVLGALSPWLPALFTHQEQLAGAVDAYLWPVILLPLISVWAYWLDGVAIGFTASRAMRNSALICTFGIFLPTWWLASDLGNTGLWLAFFLFTLARGVVLGGILYHNRQRLVS